MNAAGDYSAAYCIVYTDSEHAGHGMVIDHPRDHFEKEKKIHVTTDIHNRSR